MAGMDDWSPVETTLDEPVSETIRRDLREVGAKLKLVLLPRASQHGVLDRLKEWDLWGPLAVCLTLSIALSAGAPESQRALVFAAVFVVVLRLCGNQPVCRVAVLAPSSGEEPAPPRYRAGVASMDTPSYFYFHTGLGGRRDRHAERPIVRRPHQLLPERLRAGLFDLSPGLRRLRVLAPPRAHEKFSVETSSSRHLLRLVDARVRRLLQRDHRGEKARAGHLPRLRLLRVPRLDDPHHGELGMRK